MYTATMLYQFKDEAFEEACAIWDEEIMEHARIQPGFVRMQLLTARPKALAIGTWESHEDANRFMQTGAFRRLLGRLTGMTTQAPQQTIWDLRYYRQK